MPFGNKGKKQNDRTVPLRDKRRKDSYAHRTKKGDKTPFGQHSRNALMAKAPTREKTTSPRWKRRKTYIEGVKNNKT